MDTFPIELWRLIINHLPTSTAINLSLTSRHFYNAFIDDIYYNHINFDYLQHEPLRYGVIWGYCTTVERALSQGADPNQHVSTTQGDFLALAIAVSRQDVSMVELLLRYGADPLAVCMNHDEWDTPLAIAAMIGNCEIMEMILKTEAKTVVSRQGRSLMPAPKLPNVRNGRGMTMLQIAVKYSHCAMVKFLLASGARINARDSQGQTAMIQAVIKGNIKVVNILLKAGADLSPVWTWGNDALAHAFDRVGYGEEHTTVFTTVITARCGARDTTPGLCYGLTEAQVHQYLIDARPFQIKALTELGFSVDAKSHAGLTPLLMLCEHPDLTMPQDSTGFRSDRETREGLIDSFLHAGAEPNITDNRDGSTPLIKSATWSSGATIQTLLARGARSEVMDKYGMTALAYAAWVGSNPNIDALLPENQRSESVDGRKSDHILIDKLVENDELEHPYFNLNGKTPLMLTALYHERPLATKLLLKKGAEIDFRGPDGRTALAHAIRHDSVNVAAILVEHGASMTTRDSDGSTLLMQAARTGSEKSLKWLLRQGVDVNEIATSTRPYNRDTLTKETALTVAIRWGWSVAAILMINFGASVETAFELDPGLLRYCDKEGDNKSAALLRKHGGHLDWLE